MLSGHLGNSVKNVFAESVRKGGTPVCEINWWIGIVGKSSEHAAGGRRPSPMLFGTQLCTLNKPQFEFHLVV